MTRRSWPSTQPTPTRTASRTPWSSPRRSSLKLAQVGFFSGDQVNFALVDTTSPLNAIGDGVLATVRFNKIGVGEPKVTVTNLSVGDGATVTLPSSVEYGQGIEQALRHLFLPTGRPVIS